MRSPIETLIFFLGLIQVFLGSLATNPPMPSKLAEINKYSDTMMSMLMLLQTFVEDLLALRCLKSGALRLQNEEFDPVKVIKTVLDVFMPQALKKKIDLKYDEQG